jgi:hypothetical protein
VSAVSFTDGTYQTTPSPHEQLFDYRTDFFVEQNAFRAVHTVIQTCLAILCACLSPSKLLLEEGIREELLGLFISFSLTSITIDGILRMVDGCLKLHFGPGHTNLWAISR